jgi:beta-lactam-binding protein with PASTA domain
VPTVAMPDVVGLTEDAAYQAVKSAQSSLQPQGYYAYTSQKSCNGNTDPANFGRVYAQTPAPGTPLTFRMPATASIYLSCTIVPDVVGLAHSAASQAVYGAALQVVVIGRVPCPAGETGSVVTNQDPAPGTILPNAGVVNLVETAVNCG